MSAFVLSKIFPSMSIDASQRFIFGLEESPEPLGSFKLDNIFVPTLGSPSLTNFEMRNEALSGYRWIHETASDETYGSFRLQKFLEGSPTGIDIITFNDDGSFIFPGTTDAKYILQTANANLPNAQSLGALTTGLLKNTVTTGTGVLSTATPGVDYYAPHKPTTLIDDFNLNGNINDSYGNLGVGEFVFNALTLNDPDNTYNLGVGPAALYAFTTGYDNTAIGPYSMWALETGNDNTSLGYFVAPAFQSGNNNLFAGSTAASTFVSGDNNVFLGKGVVYFLPDGSRNVVVGVDALVNVNDTCDDNVVLGYNAASIQNIYNGCIFIGKNADASANNLTNAIAIGPGALVGASNCMVLGQNVKVGIGTSTPQYKLDVVGSGGISINANSNRIIGVADPVDPEDAVNKSFLESFVGDVSEAKFIIQTADADLPNAQVLGVLATGIVKNATTTGVLSIATAGTDYYSPLNPATLTCNTSTQNASFSRNAYSSLTSGTGNAIFNVFGGQVLTSGTGNVIFAGNAGQSLTTGNSNILIGNDAGGPVSTGNSNIVIGVDAGNSLTTPNFNILIGNSAGSALQTGGNNVCLGTSAGLWGGGGFATYSDCVFLGREAIPTVSNLTNAVAIGAFASVSTSNSMVLGSNLNVGMGTSSPTQAKLVLSGGVTNVASEDSIIRALSSSNAAKIELQRTGGSGKLYELRSDNAGAFGIFDRTAVVSRLSIDTNGISTFTKNVLISTASSSDVPLYQVGHSTDVVQLGYDGSNGYSFINIAGSSNDRLAFRVGGTGIAALLSSGLFGLGTISPTQAKFVVVGGVANVASEDSSIRATGNSNATKIELENTTASTGRNYEFRSNNDGTFGIFDRTSAASRFYINTSGNIGIGTTSPTTGKIVVSGGVQNVSNEETILRGISALSNVKIELQATGGSGKLYEIRSSSVGSFDITDRSGNATRFLITSGGNIGINMGTSAPNCALQLNNTTASRKFVFFESANNDHQVKGIGHDAGVFRFQINQTSDSYVFYAATSSSASDEVARISGTGTLTIAKIMGRTANAPSISAGSAAGSSPTVTVAGSEVSGTITVIAGSSPSGTTIATLTLTAANSNSSYGVNITPANQSTAALATSDWINVTSTTQFTLNNATALTNGTTYKWNYHVLGC